jgi:prepilin-type N-terminal cleavage/methylation domain-containing protein
MSRPAFTLVELLIVIAIIGLLFAMLLSTMSSIEFLKKNTGCAKNLKDIYVALQSYADTSDGAYPYPISNYWGNSFSGPYNAKDRWLGLPQLARLVEYGAKKEMFFCPFDANYNDWEAWPNSTWEQPYYQSSNSTVTVYIGYTFFIYRGYPYGRWIFSNMYMPITHSSGLDDTPLAADTLSARIDGSLKAGWYHGGGVANGSTEGLYNSSCNTLFKSGVVVFTDAEDFDWSKSVHRDVYGSTQQDWWWCALEPTK